MSTPQRHRGPTGAVLTRVRAPANTGSAVLVLHGGSADSLEGVGPLNLAALRLAALARAVADRLLPATAVYRLRNSVRGWNRDGAAVLADARWAVRIIAQAHPDVPIVVVGHSLGGRVAVHVAQDGWPVVGAVGLAPWLVASDPVDGLRGVTLSIVQGTGDRMIPTSSTEPYLNRAAAVGALVHREVVDGGEHTMLRRHRRWHQLSADGVALVMESTDHITLC